MASNMPSGIYWADLTGGDLGYTHPASGSSILVSGLHVSPHWGPRSLTVTSDEKLYFCQKDITSRCDLDGSNIEVLTSGAELPPPLGFPDNGVYTFYGLSVDENDEYLFFTDGYNDQVIRTNLDGGDITAIYAGSSPMGLGGQRSLSLDVTNNHVYWMRYKENAPNWDVSIERSDYDGDHLETVALRTIPNLSSGLPIDWLYVDSYRQRIYWTNWTDKVIEVSGIDSGVDPEIIVSGISDPSAIFVDVDYGEVYWGDMGSGTISRSRFNGNRAEVVVSGLGNPKGIFGRLTPLVEPEEEPVLTPHWWMELRGDQIVSTFDSGLFEVNVRVWDVVGGDNTELEITNSGCYRIGDTGAWGWALSNLPSSNSVAIKQYYFQMITDAGDSAYGQFLIER